MPRTSPLSSPPLPEVPLLTYDDLLSNFFELVGNPTPTEMSARQIKLHLIPAFAWLATELKHDVRHLDHAILLVAGQQDYLLPDEVAWVMELYWNNMYLTPASLLKWDHEGTSWRGQPNSDVLNDWAVSGRRIFLLFPPSAAAIATDPYIAMRFIAGVPNLTSEGPYNLAESDQYLAVLRAAIRYLRSHPSDTNNIKLANYAEEMKELLPQAIRRARNLIHDFTPSFQVYTERTGGAR